MASSNSVAKVESGFWALGAGELREFERRIGRRFSAEDIRALDDAAVNVMHAALHKHWSDIEAAKNPMNIAYQADTTPGQHNLYEIGLEETDEEYAAIAGRWVNTRPGTLLFWTAALPDNVHDDFQSVARWAMKKGYRPALPEEVNLFVRKVELMECHAGTIGLSVGFCTTGPREIPRAFFLQNKGGNAILIKGDRHYRVCRILFVKN